MQNKIIYIIYIHSRIKTWNLGHKTYFINMGPRLRAPLGESTCNFFWTKNVNHHPQDPQIHLT